MDVFKASEMIYVTIGKVRIECDTAREAYALICSLNTQKAWREFVAFFSGEHLKGGK